MITIYFDESGNTGKQIADLDQPFFILGSCDYSETEASQLLKQLGSSQATEAHFKKLRKTKRGQDKIINLLSSSLVEKNRFKSHVTHKRFMLLTKVIDELLEPLYWKFGENFYKNGHNIALANMLQYVLPVAAGQRNFDEFIISYYEMRNKRSSGSIDSFYKKIKTMQDSCIANKLPMKHHLELLYATKTIVKDVINSNPVHSLNPAIPAFFALCVCWGKQYQEFDALCDDSQPVERQTSFLKSFADLKKQRITVGYGANQFELPLKLRQISFTASHKSAGIQIADIITSSLAYYINKKQKEQTDDILFRRLEQLGKLDSLITGAMWPSLDVTPEDLGRSEEELKPSPPDMVSDFLASPHSNS